MHIRSAADLSHARSSNLLPYKLGVLSPGAPVLITEIEVACNGARSSRHGLGRLIHQHEFIHFNDDWHCLADLHHNSLGASCRTNKSLSNLIYSHTTHKSGNGFKSKNTV